MAIKVKLISSLTYYKVWSLKNCQLHKKQFFFASKLFNKIQFLFICVRVLLLPSDLSRTKKKSNISTRAHTQKIIIKTIKVGLDISLFILGIDYAVNKYKHKIGSSYINPGPKIIWVKVYHFQRHWETNSYRQILGGFLSFIYFFIFPFLFFFVLTIRYDFSFVISGKL